jgi:fatty-acyl-CoA synthase
VSRPPIQFPQAELTLRTQMELRAEHPESSNKVFLKHHDRNWTYAQFRNESARMGRFLHGRLGTIDDERPGHVAMILENHLELLSIYGGCGVAGLTLFGINTGLRGDTLAGVINHARARLVIVDERFLPELDKVRGRLKDIQPENVLVLPSAGGKVDSAVNLTACVEREVGAADRDTRMPDVNVTQDSNVMVIYTSGTTGLPKGINNNNLKLCFVGLGVSTNLGIGQDDVGYTCMPLFHSNSIFVGLMPAFWVGGAVGIRERFSASSFVPDLLKYGVTYWNYVGEPVHYVLSHLEQRYGSDLARLRAEVTNHPDNKFRYAVGNGAAPPDIDKFMDWMGLEDMFELYGSTEAAISTFRKKGDPRGSVGEVTDGNVKILDERGGECPSADLDADGKILNYEQCVGEICRVAPDTALFQGYFDNPGANTSKYRDGVYHSGDLGHILARDGKRFLYFDGRTDDWIRKDGENFSALQVARLLSEHPDVPLAAAYGVPCSVSDELVMAALKLRDGAKFDPQSYFAFCDRQVEHGGMDRKWFPDFVRIVSDFEYTGTQKILVRNLKAVHFDPRRIKDPLYYRERGDKAFRPFGATEFEALRKRFAAAEKLELLDR